MDLTDALEFIKKTKQPAAYFDTQKERYRFQNLIMENNQTIYRYLSPTQSMDIRVK